MKSDFDIGQYIIANRDDLQNWGEFVAKTIVDEHSSLLKMPVYPRVKDPDSARKKQLKKMYSNPAVDMTDLVGVRFVVLTSDDLEPILQTINASTNWTPKQTRNPDAEAASDPSSFGYQSHHYELRPTSGDPWCCEVQVRTLLQHTMAELSHDAFYKASQKVPSQALRLVARSIALMETTDELLCMAMESVRAAQAPFDAFTAEAVAQAAAIGGGGADLIDDLFKAYAEFITYEGLEEFRSFLRQRSFILGKIASRAGKGIFAFPASCLVVYWLAERKPRRIVKHWPFPGSSDDLSQILSDLGISH